MKVQLLIQIITGMSWIISLICVLIKLVLRIVFNINVYINCSCAVLPDRPYMALRGCWCDALRCRTSTKLTLPGLPLSPEQTSLSVGRPWWSSTLALVFYVG